MENEETQQSEPEDPTTQVSSPDAPSSEAAPEPNMSVGAPAVDAAADEKQKKLDELCGAITDPKLAPPDLMVKANDMAADSKYNPFNKLPGGGVIADLQKGLAKGPAGFGFGDQAKQDCIDWGNMTPGERVGKTWNDIKSYAKSKLPSFLGGN
jgi:hypothetical protein